VALLALILPAQFMCGASCLTDASRALFAFARDGAVPFPRTVAFVHPKTHVVSLGVWFGSFCFRGCVLSASIWFRV